MVCSTSVGADMKMKRFVSLTVLAATCAFSFGQANAQSLSGNSGPAEIPPTSFTANQYVDSKGCVYIRAGVDGNTTWVPRVSRSRSLVCGLTPSLGSSARATASAAPSAVPAPVVIGTNSVNPPTAATATVAAAPAAVAPVRSARPSVANILAPNPVRTVASTPAARAPQVQRVNIPQPRGIAKPPRRVATAPVQQRLPQVRTQTQPRAVAVQPRVVRAPQTTTVRAQGAQTCPNISAVGQRYVGNRGTVVRCGPQTTPFITRAGDVKGGTFRSASGKVLNANQVNPNAIVVPRHVYEQQQAARIQQPVPQGMRPAWNDDRLNPRRAHQTLAGKARTDMIWTQTVPRRLIMTSTGRDVTRSFPQLQYPYTSMAQQYAAYSAAVQPGTVVSTRNQTAVAKTTRTVRQQQTRVSTKSVAPRKQAQVAGKRFVQVGTFGVASNAQRTAGQLQRMGLPVRIGTFNRGGKQMRIVLAGPFASNAHVNGALNAVRNAGFRDAFARN